VIEECLRRDLMLDVLDELWANATMSEAKASELGPMRQPLSLGSSQVPRCR
jgi:hypothetical protein